MTPRRVAIAVVIVAAAVFAEMTLRTLAGQETKAIQLASAISFLVIIVAGSIASSYRR